MNSEISIRCFLSHLAYLLYNKKSCVLSILWNTQDFVIYFFSENNRFVRHYSASQIVRTPSIPMPLRISSSNIIA